MNEQYNAGWNARCDNKSGRHRELRGKDVEYLRGYWDCDLAICTAIKQSVKEQRATIYPSKKE